MTLGLWDAAGMDEVREYYVALGRPLSPVFIEKDFRLLFNWPIFSGDCSMLGPVWVPGLKEQSRSIS